MASFVRQVSDAFNLIEDERYAATFYQAANIIIKKAKEGELGGEEKEDFKV